MPAPMTRASIEARHLTLDQAVLEEIARAHDAGELGDGYRVEPRCYVCCEVESLDLVNVLLAGGYTNRQIAETCGHINARRRDNGDERIIRARNVWVHRTAHFNIDKPAQAMLRKIMERHAEKANLDYVNGTGHTVVPLAVIETVMWQGYRKVTDEEAPTVPTVKETIDAAAKLHEITQRDSRGAKMADLLHTMDRIIVAAQKFVPSERHEEFLAEVEGRELPKKPMEVLTERVHERAHQAIREFTPSKKADEDDAF